jgi:hypothetical protein
MEKTTKFILKVLNFGIVFILFGCEKDLYEDKIYQSKINVEKVSLKDSKSNIKINANLFKAISKINVKNKSTAGRIVYDSINNIYFDDEKGIKITKDDYESYTFKIIKENGDLENLLFSKNQYNEFEAFIVKYSYTEEEMKHLNSQDIRPNEMISLSDSTNTNRMIYVSFLVSACSGIPYDCGGSICGFFEVAFSMWIDDFGGNGSGINVGGGVESGGGGSTGNGTGVITMPNVTDEDSNNETPCDKMKKLLDPTKANLKPAIVTLQGTLNQQGENLTSFKKNAANAFNIEPQPSTSINAVAGPLGPNYYGEAHTHPFQGPYASYPMFSWSDIYRLLQFYQYTGSWNQNNVAIIGVFKDDFGVDQVYGVTANDITAFIAQMNLVIDSIPIPIIFPARDRFRYLDTELGDRYATDNNYERVFLEYFANYNISLFRANSTITNWEELKLVTPILPSPPTPLVVQPIPCSN